MKNQQTLQTKQKEQLPITIKTSYIPACLSKKDKNGLELYERNLTVAQTLKSDLIRNVKNQISEQSLLTAVTFLVMTASKTNAIYKEINPDLSIRLSIDLLEKFDYDSLEDIVLMFKYARQGKLMFNDYSKKKSFYETVLNDWFPAYMDLKAEEREKQRGEAKAIEMSSLDNAWDEKSRKKIREIRMSISKSNEEKSKPQGIMHNQDDYKEYLKNHVKNISTYQLKRLVVSWCKYMDKRHYVHIFVTEIKDRKSSIKNDNPRTNQSKA